MKLFLLPFLIFFTIVCTAPVAQAAVYSIEGDSTSFTSEGFFQVDLYLDSQGEVINAFEGDLILPKELVNIVDIRLGGSFVSFWVEQPKQTSTSSVRFAGIFPGGYSGNSALLFSVIGQVKDSATRLTSESPFLGNISVINRNVLLHDGLGSPAETSFKPFSFSITQSAGNNNQAILQANDTEPPEIFSPMVTQDQNLNEGLHTLVFRTQDKGVGVSHYEVYESDKPLENIEEEVEWKKVESPYLLQDQTLSRLIYVKAVDKQGNERIVYVPAQHPLGGYSTQSIWVIIITVFLVLVILALILWHHRQPHVLVMENKNNNENENE